MTLNDIDGRPTPDEILNDRRKHDSGGGGDDDPDSSYDRGRKFVKKFVEEHLDPGEYVYRSARRILIDIGERGRRERPGLGDSQAVGRTLAAHERGVTPDDYLPDVSVSEWSGNERTTWRIEVNER